MKQLLDIARGRIVLALAAVAAVPSSGQMTAGTTGAGPAPARLEQRAVATRAVNSRPARIAALALPNRAATDAPVEDLFAGHSWYVAPPPPPPAPPPPPEPPPVPTAPPLPYTFMGSYAQDGEAVVYFLVKADRVYDVKVGDMLDDTYSVDAVSNGTMALTYKPLNIQQTLAVGGGT